MLLAINDETECSLTFPPCDQTSACAVLSGRGAIGFEPEVLGCLCGNHPFMFSAFRDDVAGCSSPSVTLASGGRAMNFVGKGKLPVVAARLSMGLLLRTPDNILERVQSEERATIKWGAGRLLES